MAVIKVSLRPSITLAKLIIHIDNFKNKIIQHNATFLIRNKKRQLSNFCAGINKY